MPNPHFNPHPFRPMDQQRPSSTGWYRVCADCHEGTQDATYIDGRPVHPCPDCGHVTHLDTTGALVPCDRCEDAAQLGDLAPCAEIRPAAPYFTDSRHVTSDTHGLYASHALTQCGPECRAELPPGATLEPWTDADTAELAAEMRNAEWAIADRHSEARAGADRMRQMGQPESATWRDCDAANAYPNDSASRAYAGQYKSRTYRLERDTTERGPMSAYRPDDRPLAILAVAREAIRAAAARH